MELLLVAAVALGASLLTVVSGFGLGTVLMPALACLVAPEAAVALTAVVHLLANLLKVGLVGREAHRPTLLAFGLPALLGGLAGGWLLQAWARDVAPIVWSLGPFECWTYPAPLAIGIVMLGMAAVELDPRFAGWRPSARWLPLGGAVSGLLGGLSGHQGAIRSAFLAGLPGLSPVAFAATGAVIACAVDIARLAAYGTAAWAPAAEHPEMLATAGIAALAGTWLGARWIRKVTLPFVRRVVALAVIVVAVRLITGGFPLPA
jgi:uncharacterized membrane protein YfcA